MENDYRYPGAQPFSDKDQNRFFGRQKDIDDLSELIDLEKLVVLYSKSGLGKSSLLNAGILPRLERTNQYQSFKIRFGGYAEQSEHVDDPLNVTRKRLNFPAPEVDFDQVLQDDSSLWSMLKLRQMSAPFETLPTFLLIFDQFEELFDYPVKSIQNFSEGLGELLHTKIPKRIRQALLTREMPSDTFLRDLNQNIDIKLLFIIRSDRLFLLNRIKPFLPTIMQNGYELKPLSKDQAGVAILSPAQLPQRQEGEINFLSPPFEFEPAALDKMIDYLTLGGQREIESFQLQVLCSHAEQLVIDKGLQKIKAKDLGEVENVYTNYYDNQIGLIKKKEDQKNAQNLIEQGLIFEQDQRRVSLYEGQIFSHYSMDKEILQQLEDYRLIRSELKEDSLYYEISHDTLVGPILRSRDQRREKAALAKRKMIQKIAMIIASLVLVFSIFLVVNDAETDKEDAFISNEEGRKILYDTIVVHTQELIDSAIVEGDYNEVINQLQFLLAEHPDSLKNDLRLQALGEAKRKRDTLVPEFDALVLKGEGALKGDQFELAMESFKAAEALQLGNVRQLVVDENIESIKEKVIPVYNNRVWQAYIFMKAGHCDLARQELDQTRKWLIYIPNESLAIKTKNERLYVENVCGK